MAPACCEFVELNMHFRGQDVIRNIFLGNIKIFLDEARAESVQALTGTVPLRKLLISS